MTNKLKIMNNEILQELGISLQPLQRLMGRNSLETFTSTIGLISTTQVLSSIPMWSPSKSSWSSTKGTSRKSKQN